MPGRQQPPRAGIGAAVKDERPEMNRVLAGVLMTVMASAPALADEQELDVLGLQRGGDTTYAGGISAGGTFADCDALQAEASEGFGRCQAEVWDCIVTRIGEKRARLIQHGHIGYDWQIPFQCGAEVVTRMFFGGLPRALSTPAKPGPSPETP
jgi:hypothetical protein